MNPAAGPPSPVFTLSPVRPFLTSLTRAGPSGPSKPLIPHPKTMWEVWRWPSARALGPETGGRGRGGRVGIQSHVVGSCK